MLPSVGGRVKQISETTTIGTLADGVIRANPGPAADFQAGKLTALNSLKGAVMKLSKGKANPQLAGQILQKRLLPLIVRSLLSWKLGVRKGKRARPHWRQRRAPQ
jgi:GatB domain